MIVTILLCILIILQIIVLSHLLYTNHKRYKDDQAFWRDIHEKEDKLHNDLAVVITQMNEAEEVTKSEQDKSL